MKGFLDNTIAKNLYENLAYRPYCGNTKSASLIRKKKYAIRFDYLVLNLPLQTAWMTFDIDHVDMMIWDKAGLPSPNFIVRDPVSGRGHITYAIESVCTSRLGRCKPQKYLRAIQLTMSHLLQSDPDYNNRITKNPFSKSWSTTWLHDHKYSLGELHEYLPTLLSIEKQLDGNSEDNYSHRNCSLFNYTRKWAYQNVNHFRQSYCFDTWLQYVSQQTLIYSKRFYCQKRGVLSINEVSGIARSIAKWCWHHYKTKKVLQLAPDLSKKERQQQGAFYTHSCRRSKTEENIKKSLEQLIKQGKKITQSSVMKLSGLSRNTIYRYKHLFDNTKDISSHKNKNVLNASHQVTAAGDICTKVKKKKELSNKIYSSTNKRSNEELIIKNDKTLDNDKKLVENTIIYNRSLDREYKIYTLKNLLFIPILLHDMVSYNSLYDYIRSKSFQMD